MPKLGSNYITYIIKDIMIIAKFNLLINENALVRTLYK